MQTTKLFDYLAEENPRGTFYYEVTMEQDINLVNRWVQIDCGCSAYALEMNELLPQLLAMMQRLPKYTGSVLNKNVKVIRHALT